MKKIKNLFFFIVLVLCINGCETRQVDEELTTNLDELTIGEAKAFIDLQRLSQFELKAGRFQEQTIAIRADWGKAKKSSNGELSVVEADIEGMGRFGFATTESMDAWKATRKDGYRTSLTKLVVFKVKKTGEIYSCIMSIAAEKQLLQKKNFDLSKNTYLDREKDLSGYVLFHELSGKFANGWIYCDGNIENSITSIDFEDLPIQLKAANMYMLYQWIETCSKYTTIGMVGGEIVSVYSETHCSTSLEYVGTFSTGTSTGSGSTGGGGTTGGYTPTNQGCDCPQLCPVCGKCIDLLKSAPLPGTVTTTTTVIANCEYCIGHPESDINKPCAGDPIKDPSIATSGASGQTGGMYGCVRQGGSNCSDGIYNKRHGGIDIYAPENSDLYSISAGKVTYVGYITDLGNCIQVTSSDNSTSILYAHLNSQSMKNGDIVKIGGKLGLTGKTGNASDPSIIPHVHIQVKVNGIATDPQSFLSTTFNSDGSVNTKCNN